MSKKTLSVGQRLAHNTPISFEISICFMYIDLQKIYKCCPLWLRDLQWHRKRGERDKSEVGMLPLAVIL